MTRKTGAVREQQADLFSDPGINNPRLNSPPPQRRHNPLGNRVDPKDRHFHEWYRFVLSFPPHLVRTYLEKFSAPEDAVLLDPFCGCGTTLVEGKLSGLRTIGIEANPFAQFASRIKTDWEIKPEELSEDAETIARRALDRLAREGIDDSGFLSEFPEDIEWRTLSEEKMKLLLTDSISRIPLHKSLILLEIINKFGKDRLKGHELLAFSKALVFGISNLHFGPEVGIGSIKTDVPVISIWLQEIKTMVDDSQSLTRKKLPVSEVCLADARNMDQHLDPNSVDMVITSPPYPNEKDYTRTTRLESVLLGFINDRAGLRSLKSNLIRSNTRNVYKSDDDDKWIANHK